MQKNSYNLKIIGIYFNYIFSRMTNIVFKNTVFYLQKKRKFELPPFSTKLFFTFHIIRGL